MLRPGQLLHNGRYRIEERIGKGGQGSVYKARARHLNTVVAIKEAEMNSPTFYQAFEREKDKLARHRHSGLPKALDYFEEGQNQYLVMEYFEGPDFAQHLSQHKQPFAVSDVLRWADSLLDVVIYLHSLRPPLIHRDIKPANLKLDGHGQVILLDLGIAIGGLSQLTTFNRPNGYTQGYAPLEQELDEPTDERADIYAIAATLYHLLTYKRPPSATIREEKKRVGHPDPLRRADELNPQVPRQLADLLAQAMALDPANRPASAMVMRAKLTKLSHPNLPSALPSVSHPRLSAPQPPPTPPPAPPLRQPRYVYTGEPIPPWVVLWRRLIAAAVVLLLAIFFVGILLSVIPSNSSQPQATQIAANPTQPQVPPATQASAPAATQAPAPPAPPTQAPSATNQPTKEPPVVASTPTALPFNAISNDNAQEVVQLARFGKGEIQEIAYSPDGSLLAAASMLGVYIYNAQTLEQVRLIKSNHFILSVAFSTDGQLVAAGGSSDPTIRLWRVSDGTLVRELVGHERTVNSVRFSPDGQILASGSNDSTVRLWNLSTGTLQRTLTGHSGGVTDLGFDATGQVLASASYDTTTRVWQSNDGSLLGTLEGHTDWVREVAVHPNGQLIATSSEDGTVNVWQEDNLLYTLDDFNGRVDSVAFAPNGQMLAIGARYKNEISLRQPQDGALLETIERIGVYDLTFSPDGNHLASMFWGHSVGLWRKPANQAQGFAAFEDRRDHTNGMTSVALSPDGQFVASGSYDQRVRVWNWQENRLFGPFHGHANTATSVAFSGAVQDGERMPYFVSGSRDNSIVVWNNGEVIGRLEGHEEAVTTVAFQKSGLIVASGSNDNTVRLWNSDGLLHTLNGHTDHVTSVIFNQNEQHVISGSKDGTVRVWKVEERTLVRTFSGLESGVMSVAEANNDQFIAAGLENGKIVVWQDGALLSTLEGHKGRVNALTFMADGCLLASGSNDDSTIRLWNIEDGNLLHTLKGHNAGVTGLIFSADGTQLFSSSYDGTIRRWGIAGK